MTSRTVVLVLWGVFAAVWLIGAIDAKPGTGRAGRSPSLLVVAVFVLLRVLKVNALAIHSQVVEVAGLVLVAAGLALAIWARLYLGRNWGMPMSRKDEPELVTSGPYRYVRHPIYSGILLAILGSALASNVYWLIGLVALTGYFIYSARTEERLMSSSFPAAYPDYRARTKMLIPFVL